MQYFFRQTIFLDKQQYAALSASMRELGEAVWGRPLRTSRTRDTPCAVPSAPRFPVAVRTLFGGSCPRAPLPSSPAWSVTPHPQV